MGVITYCLLAGFPPFRSVNLKGLKHQILYRWVKQDKNHTTQGILLTVRRECLSTPMRRSSEVSNAVFFCTGAVSVAAAPRDTHLHWRHSKEDQAHGRWR